MPYSILIQYSVPACKYLSLRRRRQLVANCHVGSRSAPLAAGARLIAAPTPRRRHLARRETALHRRQNKQTGGRGAAAAAKTSTFASASLLVLSQAHTRAIRVAPRGHDHRDSNRQHKGAGSNAGRSCHGVMQVLYALQNRLMDIRLVLSAGARALRRRAAAAEAAAAAHGLAAARGRWRGGARTAAATRRHCSSAADDDNDAAPAAPPARQLPARSVLSLHLHTGRVIGAARSALSC